MQAPVRHGKSEFLSHFFPTWYLINHPDHRVMVLGHSDEFATEFSSKIRNTFREWAGPLAGLRLHADAHKAYDWKVHGRRGGCYAGNVSGASGRGANLLIGDDIIKSQEHSNSPTIRNNVWTSWNADAYGTRLEPDGKCILVMSRRHQDDPVGRTINAIDPSNDRWRVLRLPALSDGPETDPMGRAEGEPLWPGRFTRDQLLATRDEQYRSGTGYLWETLYQQSPTGDPSTREWPDQYFDDIYYDEIPPGLQRRFRFLAVDPSKGAKTRTGDYAAFMDVTGTAGDAPRLWVNPYLRQMPSRDVEEHTLQMMQTGHFSAVIVDGNFGQDLIARNIYLKAQAMKCPVPVYSYTTKEHKETRIRIRLGPPLALGRLKLLCPRLSPTSPICLEQLRGFPSYNHDDGPDALEMALQYIEWLYGGKSRLMANGVAMQLAV